ncbi:hypothetical protein CEXT_812181 [Caerostris extrusa]|uniref:Uncharacterized protein n=1 Tax=Caerostris extrusa TaxID=172846 RepID=A0AAV4TES7_CAEEX|nr:hypothetical protein CEXT_812181 [Caerostris extrusa]
MQDFASSYTYKKFRFIKVENKILLYIQYHKNCQFYILSSCGVPQASNIWETAKDSHLNHNLGVDTLSLLSIRYHSRRTNPSPAFILRNHRKLLPSINHVDEQ